MKGVSYMCPSYIYGMVFGTKMTAQVRPQNSKRA